MHTGLFSDCLARTAPNPRRLPCATCLAHKPAGEALAEEVWENGGRKAPAPRPYQRWREFSNRV